MVAAAGGDPDVVRMIRRAGGAAGRRAAGAAAGGRRGIGADDGRTAHRDHRTGAHRRLARARAQAREPAGPRDRRRGAQPRARCRRRSASARSTSSARPPPKPSKARALVIVASPIMAIRAVFAEIAPVLLEGAVVTDVASTKSNVARWAKEFLPTGVHFVGGHPMAGKETTGIDEAEAGLVRGQAVGRLAFRDAPTRTSVQTVVGLAQLVGARPVFMDAGRARQLRRGDQPSAARRSRRRSSRRPSAAPPGRSSRSLRRAASATRRGSRRVRRRWRTTSLRRTARTCMHWIDRFQDGAVALPRRDRVDGGRDRLLEAFARAQLERDNYMINGAPQRDSAANRWRRSSFADILLGSKLAGMMKQQEEMLRAGGSARRREETLMDRVIAPVRRLRGTIAVPGDKSISHRAAILNALADGDADRPRTSSPARTACSTLAVLRALGVACTLDRPARRRSLRDPRRRPRGLREPDGRARLRQLRHDDAADVAACSPASRSTACSPATHRCARGRWRASSTPLRRDGRAHRRPRRRRRWRRSPSAAAPCTASAIACRSPSAQTKSAILLAGLFADGRDRSSRSRRRRATTPSACWRRWARASSREGPAVRLTPGAGLAAALDARAERHLGGGVLDGRRGGAPRRRAAADRRRHEPDAQRHHRCPARDGRRPIASKRSARSAASRSPTSSCGRRASRRHASAAR